MRYKTTIEIVTDAGDKNEAMEIAGDYLSGNIISGVRMKCRAKPVSYYTARTTVSVFVVVLLLAVNLMFTVHGKHSAGLNNRIIVATDAIQPPLKTSIADKNNSSFRKDWQAIQAKEAIDYLKK
jgi:hypothetical protein